MSELTMLWVKRVVRFSSKTGGDKEGRLGIREL